MAHTRMVINYVPGEECRIAIVEDGKLEEYYAEPVDEVSRVNNIYIGRVTNVESSIQAAFVDFGLEENGFLHTSDLHPKYFDGDDSTERVGHKTPRRERPPIQHCLKRGQQIAVQVLKEGVGTKGPTLTSYLSIPGRYLVMMPDMDKVGVSRKVEDEDTRKKMKQILDQLDLPDGFGFILRTAGLDRNKTELKRDLAYLQRLWKDMEIRRKKGASKPRLLYSESDLLVRSLRDLLTKEIEEVVIDHPSALKRAERFMKIVSPRAGARLMHYTGEAPIFHAFGIEQQILNIHAREVPLPSGGRLVIDETEALVAIDVNSGKSKSAKDAETNAYQTNLEAADEICRQLRLRDLGGLVIHDLIDMRHASHRKAVEQRFKDRLKRDRAKTTVLPISGFGIMEMTRQRMRGSHEKTHFAECPTCRGRGLVQRAHSVASDALRELAQLLTSDRVSRVEMVVHPRIAAALLSTKRKALTRIEHASGKAVDVRLSENIPIDRVSFYAYDLTGADIALDRLPKPKGEPSVQQWSSGEAEGDEAWAVDLAEEDEEFDFEEVDPLAQAEEEMAASASDGKGADAKSAEGDGEGKKKKRRRRRRRGRKPGESQDGADTPDAADAGESAADDTDEQAEAEESAAADASGEGASETSEPRAEGEGGKKKKRRRRRRRRKGGEPVGADGQASSGDASEEDADREETDREDAAESDAAEPLAGADGERADTRGEPEQAEAKPTKKRSRRRGRSSRKQDDAPAPTVDAPEPLAAEPVAGEPVSAEPVSADQEAPATKPTRKRSKKSGKKTSKASSDAAAAVTEAKPAEKTSAKSGAKSSERASEKAGGKPAAGNAKAGADEAAKPAAKVRSLYGASRRRLAPSERGRGPGAE